MQLALINPESRFGDPPLGLAYIAAYIREKHQDLKIKIIDKENIINTIKKFKPDMIGISAVSETFYESNKLGEKIKRVYNGPLVLGGVHITICPQDFKDSIFDIAVIGEGEITTEELIQEFKKNKLEDKKALRNIKGIIYRDNKNIIKTEPRDFIANLDTIPMPARDLLKMEFYNQARNNRGILMKYGSIITSRGCPFNCSFCSTSLFWKNKIRYHSPRRIIKEIEFLINEYNVKVISIYDDLFMANKKQLKEVSNMIVSKGINEKVEFWMQARADIIDEETIDLLKKMNVKSIAFGFESGSDRILTELKGKIASITKNQKAVDLCNMAEIKVGGLFIIGSPYETEDDIKKTYNFIKNNKLAGATVYRAYPFPGTRLFDYAVKNNIIPINFYSKPHKRLWLGDNISFLVSRDINQKKFEEWVKKIETLTLSINKHQNVKILNWTNLKNFINPRFIKRNIYVRVKRLEEKWRKSAYN